MQVKCNGNYERPKSRGTKLGLVRVELKRLTLQCSTNKNKGYFVDVSQVQPFPSFGVRELRQDASAILRRIKAGEIIEITEHGKPVAQIGPIQSSIVETWIARNLITPAKALGALSSARPVKSANELSSKELLDYIQCG